MVGQRGRPRGYPKSGGAKKGSIRTNSKAVKDAIREVFFDDLGGKAYLRKIAKNDESLFVSLLAKLIPLEVRAELEISHNLDIGKAMEEASARVAAAYQVPTPVPYQDTPLIDVTPTTESRSDEYTPTN